MKAPTVLNMKSSRGNKVPNQFIIWTDEEQFFQSYQTIIGKRDNEGNVTLIKIDGIILLQLQNTETSGLA